MDFRVERKICLEHPLTQTSSQTGPCERHRRWSMTMRLSSRHTALAGHALMHFPHLMQPTSQTSMTARNLSLVLQ